MHHKKPSTIHFPKQLLLTSLILLLTFDFIYSQSQDSLYVWANPGLNIRKTSEPNSEIISFIPFGVKIQLDWTESSDNIKLRIKESEYVNNKKSSELFLNGRMVKVNYKGQTGFVFSGFLSHLPAIPKDISIDDFLMQEFDTIKTIRSKKNPYSYQNLFDNGIISFTVGDGAGCQENTYLIPEITINEGFLIVYNIFRLGNDDNEIHETVNWYVVESKDDCIEIRGIYQLDFYASIRKINNFITISISVGN